MKLSALMLALLSTCMAYGAQKLEIPVQYFKYENDRTKVENYIIFVSEKKAKDISITFCFGEDKLTATSSSVCSKSTPPVRFKRAIAKMIGAKVDSFILCNRPFQAYDKIYGVERDKNAYKNNFDNPEKCLYIYEKLFQNLFQ